MRPGIELLQGLALFAAFDDDALAKINDLSDFARVGPDEQLYKQGDRPNELAILLSGYVALTRSQANDSHSATDIIAPVRPISFAAALSGSAMMTGAKTMTSARLLLVPTAELKLMLGAEPRLGAPFFEHALNEIQELTLDVCKLKLRSSAQRLAEYLLTLVEDPEASPARFVLPYEKRFLAGKIGCSQVNLSRAFAALRREGVESRQGVVLVRNPKALREFAGADTPEDQLDSAWIRQTPTS